MALTDKKYLDFAGLQKYDELIKAYLSAEDKKIEDAYKAADTALDTRVTATETAINTLNGEATVEGSVKKITADAVASIVAGADADFDTLKEVADWIAADTTRAAELTTKVSTNTNNIATLMGGTDVAGSVAKQIEDAKTAISNDTSDLSNRLDVIEGDVNQAGSIKKAVNDLKTELEGVDNEIKLSVGTNTTAIADLQADASNENSVAHKIEAAFTDKSTTITSGTSESYVTGKTTGVVTEFEVSFNETKLNTAISTATQEVYDAIGSIATTDIEGLFN